MDADLQHPPEVIPALVKKLEEEFDIVVASRYVRGGDVEGWSLAREIISRGATILAHILLPCTRKVKDPVSGFFGFKKNVIDGVILQSESFKVLIEVLCVGRWDKVCEVPYVFKARQRGKSKLTLGEIVKYAKHLLRLRRIIH